MTQLSTIAGAGKEKVRTFKPNLFTDFEYLRFLNNTVFKDEVLEEFMQRAEDLEVIAKPSI
jgi:hypothetical protein